MTVLTLLLTGIAYPLAVTGLCQALFPSRANGSLVEDERGQLVGSELLGQRFSGAAYFHPRPSAAGDGYDPLASGGSNFGPTSAKLRDRIQGDVARLQAENGAHDALPGELLTASASGLDPHLSPEAISFQLPRVARARGVSPERVRTLVETLLEGRDLGTLGEPRVNVLLANLALNRQFGAPTR